MSKEKELSIQLLEAKIERLTGKKVIYVEATDKEKLAKYKKQLADWDEVKEKKLADKNKNVNQPRAKKEWLKKQIKDLEAKISKKEVVNESKGVLKENTIVDLVQQAMNLLNDQTLVDIGGEMIQKGTALKAILATLGLPAAAAISTYGKGLVNKGWTLAKILTAPKTKQQTATPTQNTTNQPPVQK